MVRDISTGGAGVSYEAIIEALGYEPYDKEANWSTDTSSFISHVKTINGQSIVGTGNIDISTGEYVTQQAIINALGYLPYNADLNVKGFISTDWEIQYALGYRPLGDSSVKTINGQQLVGTGNIEIATGIQGVKTLNGTSLEGTGNIELKNILRDYDISTALGYVPYNKEANWANDTSAFLESSDLPDSLSYFTYDASADALKCTKPLYSTG